MKPATRLALRLYPRWWRHRYGPELEALLEDAPARWTDVLDLARGAFVMRIRDFRTIPLLAAVVGASIGAVLYFRTPALYASSSTLRVTGSDFLEPNSPSSRAFRDTLSRAVPGTDLRTIKAVIHVAPDGASTLVQLSHAAPDARQAQDVVKRLVAATVDGPGHLAAGESVVVVVPPGLPTTPRREHLASIPAGAGLGLVLGAALVIVRRFAGSQK